MTAGFAVAQAGVLADAGDEAGTGTGTVGATARRRSTGKYNAGTDVAVTAAPGTELQVQRGWAGRLLGHRQLCRVRMDAAKSVTARALR